MSKLIIPSDHICLTCEKDINEICAPLLHQFNLNFFQFARIYSTSEVIFLINNRSWIEYWVKNEIRAVSHISKTELDKRSYFVLWDGNVPEGYLKFAREVFNITQGISIVNRHENYYELIGFGAPAENTNALNFYINNTELLMQFTHYFKDKAENLIQLADSKKLVLPNHMQDVNQKKLLWQQQAIDHSLLEKIPIAKRYSIYQKDRKSYITLAELNCFKHLRQGKTIKQVATHLNISTRTVESYINRAKSRLNCYSTHQLLELIQSNLFL